MMNSLSSRHVLPGSIAQRLLHIEIGSRYRDCRATGTRGPMDSGDEPRNENWGDVIGSNAPQPFRVTSGRPPAFALRWISGTSPGMTIEGRPPHRSHERRLTFAECFVSET